MSKYLILLLFIGCTYKAPCWKPDIIERIGACDYDGLCSVITKTGYITTKWYPIVGQTINAKVKCGDE